MRDLEASPDEEVEREDRPELVPPRHRDRREVVQRDDRRCASVSGKRPVRRPEHAVGGDARQHDLLPDDAEADRIDAESGSARCRFVRRSPHATRSAADRARVAARSRRCARRCRSVLPNERASVDDDLHVRCSVTLADCPKQGSGRRHAGDLASDIELRRLWALTSDRSAQPRSMPLLLPATAIAFTRAAPQDLQCLLRRFVPPELRRRVRPRATSRVRNAGRRASARSICASSSSALRGSKYSAASPPISGSDDDRAAIDGTPCAIASSSGKPKPS